MDWIKCEDEKPPIGMPVLLKQTYPKETMFNCRADPLHRSFIRWGGLKYNGVYVSYENQYSDIGIEYVSHWMQIDDT